MDKNKEEITLSILIGRCLGGIFDALLSVNSAALYYQALEPRGENLIDKEFEEVLEYEMPAERDDSRLL